MKITLDNFSEGMTPDIRENRTGFSKLLKNFDILSRPNSLTPYFSHVTGDASSSTHCLTDFFYNNSRVYGAGVDNSTSKITVYYKSDFTSDVWTALSNNVGSTGVPVRGVFIDYKGSAYGFYADARVWRFKLDGSGWTDTDTTITSAAAGIGSSAAFVHPKDDILYMAAGNVIGRKNNTVWEPTALTLPDRYLISCLTDYGNYLAIGCIEKNAGNSVVYLWDRDSSLNTVAEVIDFGYGDLKVLAQIEGELIGVSERLGVFSSLKNSWIFRSYAGGTPRTFREIIASGSLSSNSIGGGKKYNANRLYFYGSIEIDGVLQIGVWCVAKNPSGRWIIWLDRLPNNNTVVASNSVRGFILVGDFAFISYEDSVYKLTQTANSSTSYTGSSVIETVINPNMADKFSNKQIVAVSVYCAPQPAAGQIILKYKVDGGSWITILTNTTDNVVSTEARFTSLVGREYQFRIESTGGTVITGFAYDYVVVKSIIS